MTAIIINLLVSILFGSLAGAIVSHLFAKTREDAARQYARAVARETRKSDFLAFMDGWRTEIERLNLHFVADQFNANCAAFRREATKIRSDYGAKFWELVEGLSALRSGEIEQGSNQGDNAPGKLKLLARLDAVVNFVDRN